MIYIFHLHELYVLMKKHTHAKHMQGHSILQAKYILLEMEAYLDDFSVFILFDVWLHHLISWCVLFCRYDGSSAYNRPPHGQDGHWKKFHGDGHSRCVISD